LHEWEISPQITQITQKRNFLRRKMTRIARMGNSPLITQTRDPSFRTDESVSEQDDKKGGLTRIARMGI